MSDSEKQKTTSYFSIIIRVGIAGIACWLIFKNTDIAELSQTFKRLSILSFLAGLAVFMGGLCLIGLRWWIFMRAQGIQIPLQMAIKLTYLGQFFTNFMPSAVGGDLVRAWHISKFTDKKLQAALGVMADRIIGLLSTLILAISGYLVFMRGRADIFNAIRKENEGLEVFFDKINFSGSHAVLGCLFFLGCVFILSSFIDLNCFLKRVYGNIVGLLRHTKEVIEVYVRYPLILVFGLGVTIFLQCMMILSLWLIGRDLGIQVPVYFYFVFFPMMWVISSLPLSIAGIGILEGGLVLLFVQFAGAEQEAATALAFCQRFIWVLASLPGMVVHLTGAHRMKDGEC
ncbi:MAG: lysylphosphatidylglycerol synthase transmembrane domain-containing protein [Planctomycetota bacterium]